jgi:chromosomal replication initiation ATPase DnaA
VKPALTPEPEPADDDFRRLVEIVADVYRCRPEQLIMRPRVHRLTQARHVVAAIWAESYSMQDAAKRLRWWTPTTVSTAIHRIDRLLAEDGIPAARIREVMRRVAKEIPHVVGLYPNQPEPSKVEGTP